MRDYAIRNADDEPELMALSEESAALRTELERVMLKIKELKSHIEWLQDRKFKLRKRNCEIEDRLNDLLVVTSAGIEDEG